MVTAPFAFFGMKSSVIWLEEAQKWTLGYRGAWHFMNTKSGLKM